MKRRYVLAPEASLDLVRICRYIKRNASPEMANPHSIGDHEKFRIATAYLAAE